MPSKYDQPGVKRTTSFEYDELSTCSLISGDLTACRLSETLNYVTHVGISDLPERPSPNRIVLDVPLPQLAKRLPSHCLRPLVKAHRMLLKKTTTVGMMVDMCDLHVCGDFCVGVYSMFQPEHWRGEVQQARCVRKIDSPPFRQDPEFNLLYPSVRDKYSMVCEWTNRISAHNLSELACGVCAQNALCKNIEYYSLKSTEIQMLSSKDVDIARRDRVSPEQPVTALEGPILCPAGIFTSMQDTQIVRVCADCHESLQEGIIPELALVRGQWIGDLPDCLQCLNMVETLAIVLCQHNNCIVQVKMGQRKLSGNAVIFSQPVDKFYDVLPPPREELDECLVVVFIGKKHPTLQDYRRTPLLFCKDVVLRALEWLKLNHQGYSDVTISPKNLDTYPAEEPPVEVRYICKEGSENPENVAVFDSESERGTKQGMCTISVQGLSGAELVNMTRDERILYALQHIDNEGQFISYGSELKIGSPG